MEQSTKDNNRKDYCRDVKERNEEPTTSKADFNGPNHAHNTNESKTLKALDFNSADDVRVAMKALTDEIPHHDETSNKFISDRHVETEVNVKSDNNDLKSSEKVSENVNKKDKRISRGANRTKPVVTKQKESRRAKKRKARASKPSAAKRYKGASVQGFYWGKLSNLIFLRNCCTSDSSSEDSFFSL